MLRFLRGQLTSPSQELNLSGCGLSDTSLHLLALHCLLPSPHPPSLNQLYLTGNDFSLSSPALTAFLGSALSSPTSSLHCLSLTSNNLGTAGVISLLGHLRLGGPGGSNLAQLHFSVCGLTPDVAEPLAKWLEDPKGGGSRLQVLCLNGNKLGSVGLRRIARAVSSGKCTGLLHLEIFANEEEDEEELDPHGWKEVEKALEEQEGEEDVEGWRERLEIAKGRNKTVFRETRLAALGLLARARVLFAGNPREADVNVEAIRRRVETLSNTDTSTSPPPPRPFPFLALPIEIQVHILRCSVLLSPSSTAPLYSPPTLPNLSSSPLTEPQFLRVLSHAADRTTLAREASFVRARIAGTVPSIAPRRQTWEYKDERNAGALDTEEAVWEEWMLRSTGCDRFERG